MLKSFVTLFAKLTASPVELHPSATCPGCGSQLAREIENSAGAWACPNPDCPPQVLKRAQLWVSAEAMDIPGFDPALVERLVNRGLVRDAADFYRLKVGEIAALPGQSQISARKLFEALTASLQREAWRVLVGLGIPHIGVGEAQALCKPFASLEDLFALGSDRLVEQTGVTDRVARSLTRWYGDGVNRRLLRRLAKAGVNCKC